MHERTLVRAYHDDGSYRHTVVNTHDHVAAFAELRRVDAIHPPHTRPYVRVTMSQWVVGDLSFGEALSFVGPEGMAALEGN
jgi:hypothetical protein